MDAALIDGDHNWYTVYHELQLLAHVSANAGAPLPVLILHDVCWPYGRRDLYYAPEQIPEEYRQPYAQRGMIPGRKDLARAGGLNPSMYNAIDEGGPRNGVMTALDDFIAEHDEPLRLVVLPIYFGLAVVATRSGWSASPSWPGCSTSSRGSRPGTRCWSWPRRPGSRACSSSTTCSTRASASSGRGRRATSTC